MSENSENKFLSSVCGILIGVGVDVAVLVLAILISKEEVKLPFTQIVENDMNNNLMFDFMVIKPDETCTDQHNEVIFGKWPAQVPGIPKGKPLNIWKSSKFCFLKDGSYKSLLDKIKPTCSSSEKDCGIIDLIGQHLCLSKSSNCPLNYFRSGGCDIYNDCQNYTFEDGSMIYYSNEPHPTRHIIKKLILADDIPCFMPNTYVSKSHFDNDGYVGECPSFEGTAIRKDIGSEFVDSAKKVDIYNQNGINLTKIVDNPTVLTTLNTFIYNSTFYGINKMKEKSDELLGGNFYEENKNRWDKGKSLSKALWIITIIGMVFCIIKAVNDLTKKEGEDNPLGGFLSFVNFGLGVTVIVISIIVFAKFNDIKKVYEYMPADLELYAKEVDFKKFNSIWGMSLANMILELLAIALAILICCCSIGLGCCLMCLAGSSKNIDI